MGSVLIKAGDSKLKRASEFSTICAYAGSRMDVRRSHTLLVEEIDAKRKAIGR